jgi:hypothetical protein
VEGGSARGVSVKVGRAGGWRRGVGGPALNDGSRINLFLSTRSASRAGELRRVNGNTVPIFGKIPLIVSVVHT